MSLVKVIEKKIVIKLFGVAFILAPFINMAIMLYVIKNQSQLSWSALPYLTILASGKIKNYLMILASLIIGVKMLSGSSKVWKWTLVLLGTHIAFQIPTIGQDIRQNWLWAPFFIANVGLWAFIADQLVFRNGMAAPTESPGARPEKSKIFQFPFLKKQKVTSASPEIPSTKNPSRVIALKPRPQSVVLKKRVPIQWAAAKGPLEWAHLKSISQAGVWISKKNPAPVDEIESKIETEEVEFSFDSATLLKAHFEKREGLDYFFKFKSITSSQSKSLNLWLEKRGA